MHAIRHIYGVYTQTPTENVRVDTEDDICLRIEQIRRRKVRAHRASVKSAQHLMQVLNIEGLLGFQLRAYCLAQVGRFRSKPLVEFRIGTASTLNVAVVLLLHLLTRRRTPLV